MGGKLKETKIIDNCKDYLIRFTLILHFSLFIIPSSLLCDIMEKSTYDGGSVFMSNSNDKMNLYESDLTRLCELVEESIKEFKRKQDGEVYSAVKVDNFLEDLTRMIRFYRGYQEPVVPVDEISHEAMSSNIDHFNVEYAKHAAAIMDAILKVRFTQNFMGYDSQKVDEFLNDLVKLKKFHGKYENVHIMIDTNAIVSKRFERTFKGYDEVEVDMFLNKMIKEFERLNDVKRLSIGD